MGDARWPGFFSQHGEGVGGWTQSQELLSRL